MHTVSPFLYRWLAIVFALGSLAGCMPSGSSSTIALPPTSVSALPLDGKLHIFISEFAGQIKLHLVTGTRAYSSSCTFHATFRAPSSRMLEVLMEGITCPEMTFADITALAWERNLGVLDGPYTITLRNGAMHDDYLLTVSSGAIDLRASTQQFTIPQHERWLRLAPDTIWFVAQNYAGTSQTAATPRDSARYTTTVQHFEALIAAAQCTPILPPQGVYAHEGFISPWPETWAEQRDTNGNVVTRIPLRNPKFTLLYEPTIQYYQCPSDALVQLAPQIASYVDAHIAVGLSAWGTNSITSRIQ